MNKLKLACISTVLACSAANAAPCDNFQIKLKNNLIEDLVVTNARLSNGEIQLSGLDKLTAGSELIYTVKKSLDNAPLQGEFTLQTMTIPVKNVKIKYDLANVGEVCGYSDIPQSSDFAVAKSPEVGAVVYNIFNK